MKRLQFYSSNMISLISVATVVIICTIRSTECAAAGKTPTEIMVSIFDNYDKRTRPDLGVTVTVSSYVLDVYSIDELKHEFTAQLYFRQRWTDSRLKYDAGALGNGVENIKLDPEYAKKIWIPDTFMVNERSSYKHDVTVDNEFTSVAPNGEVHRSTRITVTASCLMNLGWFPFDNHLCTLEFESYANTAQDFVYNWQRDAENKSKIGISGGAAGSTRFTVNAIRGRELMSQFKDKTYSHLAMEFTMSRKTARYMLELYFPALVLPFVAFMTMSIGDLQFRVLLSTLCLLAMIILTGLLSSQMPDVTYLTALDTYFFVSSLTILIVVTVNFTMHHFLKPQVRKIPTRVRMRPLNGGHEQFDEAKDILTVEHDHEPSEDFNMGKPTFTNSFQEITFFIFEKAKYTTPFVFIVFNVIYWLVILIASRPGNTEDDFLILENNQD